MPRLPRLVQQHLEKARSSALAAVEIYNKPGISFRTRTFVILMVVAWTALFHAVYFRNKRRPWYVRSGSGRGIRYHYRDGDPVHWDLAMCVKSYWRGQQPPERKNLEFMIGLRNKIEHRDHPELDPALYGECQAMLVNFEDFLCREFGDEMALSDQLGVALQFSSLRPKQQQAALRKLQGQGVSDLLEYIRTFRVGLPAEILESSRYSLSVFLIPKIANRNSAADLAAEFVPYDSSKPEEMENLRRIAALVKDRHVPIASKGLLRPGLVVDRVNELLPFEITMNVHTDAWKHYAVRPSAGSQHREKTKSQYCIYDTLAETYGYTEAWVKFLSTKLRDPQEYHRVTKRHPPAL